MIQLFSFDACGGSCFLWRAPLTISRLVLCCFSVLLSRCSSTLFTGYPERAVLLIAALTEACPGGMPGGFPRDTKRKNRTASFPGQRRRRGRPTANEPPVPLASNFSAFSHGIGWLLRTGAVADVALILPVRPGDAEEESMANDGAEEWEEEEEEEEEEEAEEQGKKAVQYLGAFIQDAAGVTGACDRGSRVDSPGSGARQRADGGGRVGGRGSGVQQGDGGVENGRQLLGEMLPGCGREGDRRAVPKARRTKKSKTEPPRFLAHSLVLGARSEKFAAMLRFVRRQDVDGGLDPSDAALDDGSNSSNIVYSSSGDIFSSDNGGDYEHSRCAGACGIHDGSSNGSGGRGGVGMGMVVGMLTLYRQRRKRAARQCQRKAPPALITLPRRAGWSRKKLPTRSLIDFQDSKKKTGIPGCAGLHLGSAPAAAVAVCGGTSLRGYWNFTRHFSLVARSDSFWSFCTRAFWTRDCRLGSCPSLRLSPMSTSCPT